MRISYWLSALGICLTGTAFGRTAPRHEFVQLPGHHRAHKSCFHEVRDDEVIDISHTPKCDVSEEIEQPASNNSIHWSFYSYTSADHDYVPPGAILAYSHEFSNILVPNPPVSSSGQVVYVFAGTKSESMIAVMQTVLLWGNNGVFGGDYWTMVSLFESNGYIYYGRKIVVPSNTWVSTYVMATQGDSRHWVVAGVHPSYGTSGINLITSYDFPQKYGMPLTLETYNVTSCSQIPVVIAFKDYYVYRPLESYSNPDEVVNPEVFDNYMARENVIPCNHNFSYGYTNDETHGHLMMFP